jgi:hypothetical protein
MAWRDTARWCGVTLAVASVATLARPASAQGLEQVLAGIRLNSKSSTVLAKFGNPNEVVIGDQGIRGGGPGSTGQGNGIPGDGATQPGGGPPGLPAPGGFGGPPGYPPSAGGFGGGGAAQGGLGRGPNASPQTPQGYPGSPQGGFGAPPDAEGFGGPGGPGGQGTTFGPFGPTTSALARQQEVTWVYNRKVNNNLVTYEFLIGPNGQVIQIRATGYKGGTARTKRGIALGTTYKTVVKAYGYPEEHILVGRTLVTSYKNKAHVQFQFLNDRGQANPMDDGNKVISITIATVE